MSGLEQKQIDELRGALRGPLILPEDAGYDEARAVWNAMIDRRPTAIARCLGVADVVAGVNFAREHGLALSVRGGGHNIAGLATGDGALMLNMSLMRGVHVDRAGGRAYAQAGCLLGDVDRETQLYGLAAPLGFVSNTGIAGLTLGGGFGYLTRRFGWTCDNVVSMDVVTADGKAVRASEDENADLFWALRGGGGNFGVVTGFEYRVYPLGPEIVGGAIAWPAEEAPRVIELFRTLMPSGPAELTCVLGLRKAPPAPWLAKEIHGKDIVALFVCYSGDPAEGERAIAPIKALGRTVGDTVGRRSYVSQQNLLDATQPSGRRYYWKSEYLGRQDVEMCQTAAKHAAAMRSPHSAILVFPLDGELNRLPAGHSPAGNRDAMSLFNVAASWEQPGDDAANIAWARGAWEELRPFSTGGTYVNFLTEEETGDRVLQAYGEHVGRLSGIKAKWDPANLFRLNKNIAPA
ncbi:MAG: FAD-binding oxidoreductase [Dehalococcoidia bacterium]